MATEYVCSACGHTFRTRDEPAEGCPACGADRARLWSVGIREPAGDGRATSPTAPAGGLAAVAEAADGADRPRRRRRRWVLPWPSIRWRMPDIACRLPAWERPGGLPRRPSRGALLLALLLALWPFPLDDDRLPAPGPGRAASGAAPPQPAAAGPVSIADLLRRAAPGTTDAREPAGPVPVHGHAGGRAPDAGPPTPVAVQATGPGLPQPESVSRPGGAGRSQPPAVPPIAGARAGGAGPNGLGAGGAGDDGRPLAVATPPAAAPASACVGADDRRLVFLIDVSVSMGLPHGTTPELENALDDAVHRGDAEALGRYRALLSEAGASSRLGLARDAFAQALEVTPAGIEVGVVSFHGCRDIRRLEPVSRPGFPGLLAGVGDLTWHRGGETALSEALREAYAMAGDGAGRIAVITDGKDTCGPPPCAIIDGLRGAKPGIRIDVVDVSGRSDAACLAVATGGSFRVAPLSGSVEAFVSSVRSLGRACPATR